ncbi:4996_t:CDS:2 [Gigaspora margarita]|uniref:4996_t:CDS:1 n=1 Tax=Gigaspora margarita TaxID=4874 RepID=A0ABN7V8W6_GIGMA|nr:4996_t:CDS:2 [Gigaspora margarita]
MDLYSEYRGMCGFLQNFGEVSMVLTIHNSDSFDLNQNTIVKKPLPNLYDSIEEKENYREEAITKSSQFY